MQFWHLLLNNTYIVIEQTCQHFIVPVYILCILAFVLLCFFPSHSLIKQPHVLQPMFSAKFALIKVQMNFMLINPMNAFHFLLSSSIRITQWCLLFVTPLPQIVDPLFSVCLFVCLFLIPLPSISLLLFLASPWKYHLLVFFFPLFHPTIKYCSFPESFLSHSFYTPMISFILTALDTSFMFQIPKFKPQAEFSLVF